MADNIAITAGAGTTVATDDVGGTHYQIVKLAHGALDSVTVVSTASGLPIQASSLPLPSGASTAAKQPALGTAGSASADVITIQGVASMTAVKVDGSAVTQPVSAASLPLPSGASTEVTVAKLAITQGSALGSNTQALIGGSVTTAAPTYTTGQISPISLTTAGALRVDGSGVTQPVSAASLPLPSGAATETSLAKLTVSQGASLGSNTQALMGGSVTTSAPSYTTGQVSPVSLTTAGAVRVDASATTQPVSVSSLPGSLTGLAEDAAHSSGAIGVLALTVRADTPASTAGADGDYAGFITDASGRLQVTAIPSTYRVDNNGTLLTPKYAVISASSSGANTIVSAVASKKIRILRYSLSANGAVNAKWQSATTPTDITGLHYLTQYSGFGASFCPVGICETVAGEALSLNLSGAVAVGGVLTYVEV